MYSSKQANLWVTLEYVSWCRFVVRKVHWHTCNRDEVQWHTQWGVHLLTVSRATIEERRLISKMDTDDFLEHENVVLLEKDRVLKVNVRSAPDFKRAIYCNSTSKKRFLFKTILPGGWKDTLRYGNCPFRDTSFSV